MFVEQQSSSSGLSTVAIVGIAVGAAAGVALLAAAALFVVRRRRRDAAAQQDLPAPKNMVSGSAAGPEAGTWSTSCGSAEGVGKLPPQYAGVNLQPRGVMLASPFGAQALTAAPSGGVHSLGSSHTTSHASSHGPQPLTAAGAAAARASSGRMPSGGLSAMLPSGGLGGGGGGIVAELMQHVALHDAQSLHTTCQLIASSSEHGQLSADLLPPRLREWLVPREQIDYMKVRSRAGWGEDVARADHAVRRCVLYCRCRDALLQPATSSHRPAARPLPPPPEVAQWEVHGAGAGRFGARVQGGECGWGLCGGWGKVKAGRGWTPCMLSSASAPACSSILARPTHQIYNGETVACKEMDLEESAAMQEAFLTVCRAARGRTPRCVCCGGRVRLPPARRLPSAHRATPRRAATRGAGGDPAAGAEAPQRDWLLRRQPGRLQGHCDHGAGGRWVPWGKQQLPLDRSHTVAALRCSSHPTPLASTQPPL